MRNSRSQILATVSAVSLLAGLSFASPAFAAAEPTADAAESTSPLDIIVTAQRRSESLSKVGVTVSVVTAEDLQTQGVQAPSDLVRLVPGFQATQSFNGNPVYVLRGVGFNSPNANSTPPVGLYMDEAAIAYPYMSTGLVFDLERVEALKGPQGTLYGRNATGGLINFVTAKPTSEFSAGATVEVGNYETVNFNGFLSGPLAEGLKIRVAVNSQNRGEGWQHSVTRDDRLGKLHQNSFRAILDYDNGGAFTATLTGNYWNRKGDTVAPQAIYYFPDPGLANPAKGNPLAEVSVRTNWTSGSQADWVPVTRQPQSDIGITRPAERVDSNFRSVTLRSGLEFSDTVKLASLTTYQKLNHADAVDMSGFQIASIFQDVTGEIESFSQEVRLIGESEKMNWSVGGYYAKDNSTQRQIGYNDENNTIATLRFYSSLIAAGLFPAGATPDTRFTPAQISRSFGNYDSRASGDSRVLSAFANIDYRFSDQFKVSLGGRYTEDRTSQTACTYDYKGGNIAVVSLYYGYIFNKTVSLNPGQCYTLDGTSSNFVSGASTNSQTQDNFAWRANAEYTPNDNTLLYATFSRGYKAGGFPLIAASRTVQFNPVRQEALTSYEVGTKLRLLDGKLRLNVSGFYYDYTDKQIFGRTPDVIFGTLSRIDNIPESHEYGIEADLMWQISNSLRFSAAGVWLKSKVDRYSGYDQFSRAADFAGKPYAYTPEFQGNALISYDQPVSEKLSVNATVAVSYQGKTNASQGQLAQFAIKDYALVGATLGLASSAGWSATLFAQNLTNTYYWNGVESATDSIFRFPGMPRTYGLRLGYRF